MFQENKKVSEEEQGATMVEYALLVALIAIIAIAGITVFGGKVSQQFSMLGSAMG